MDYSVGWTGSVVDMSISQYVGIVFLCLGSAAMTFGLMLVEGNMNNKQTHKSTTIFGIANLAWVFIYVGLKALGL